MDPASLAVRSQGLTKSYGKRVAAAGVDLEVRRGEVFGFLGPNGAGKSTTINMLCTLLEPTAGEAWVAGQDCIRAPAAVRERIGLVFQERTLDGELTARENLRFHAILYGVPAAEARDRIAALLDAMGLADRADDLVSTFSSGMARRLELARALLHAPEVLFLDEPSLGLDPASRARFWSDLSRLRAARGFTVFFTTHYMDEAEAADRLAIMHEGRLVAVGTPTTLKSQVGRDRVHLSTSQPDEAIVQLQRAGHKARRQGGDVVVDADAGTEALPLLMRTVTVPIQEARVQRPTLDDVFLHFTGQSLEPGRAR
ncbi:MAG: ATP-binding cassette domain-containing protein [Thermoplasmatota archaeon]|nr:ATP-binding cassette domain-containing protein [Halobacteriales archaeon]